MTSYLVSSLPVMSYNVWALFGTVRYLLPVCRYFEIFNTLYFEWTWNFSSHISPILLNIMTLYLVSSSAVMTCNVCALFGSVRLRVGICLADNAYNFLFVVVLHGSIVCRKFGFLTITLVPLTKFHETLINTIVSSTNEVWYWFLCPTNESLGTYSF